MIGLGSDLNPSKSVYIYTWIKCSEEKKTGKVKFWAPSGAEDYSSIGGGNSGCEPRGIFPTAEPIDVIVRGV